MAKGSCEFFIAGRKPAFLCVCVCVCGVGGLTQSSSIHRCHFSGGVCEFVSVLGSDPMPAIFKEQIDHKAALRTEKVVDMSVKALLWIHSCESSGYCLINDKG